MVVLGELKFFSYHIYLAKCEILLWVKEFLKVELGFYPFKIP